MFASFNETQFRSFDGGRTWIRIKDVPPGGPPSFAVAADGSAVYVGSYRSLDGGVHWTHLPHDRVQGVSGGEIIIDPRDPQVLMGRGNGEFSVVWLSSDGGNTWTPLFPGRGPFWYVYGYAFDPTHPGRAYTLAGKGSGYLLFESRDDGASWDPVGPATGAFGGLIISASGTFYSYNQWGIAISHDGGRTFQPIDPSIGRAVWSYVVDPNDKETVFAAARTGVFKSREGSHWTRVGGLWEVGHLAIDPHSHMLFAATPHGLYECFIGE